MNVEWSDILDRYINSAIRLSDEAALELRNAEKNSQAVEIIKIFLRLAKQKCREKGLRPDDPEAIKRLEQAYDIGYDFACCAHGFALPASTRQVETPETIRKTHALIYWAEPRTLEDSIRNEGRLMVDLASYEEATGRYVQGNLKSPELDRLILTGLIDMECSDPR